MTGQSLRIFLALALFWAGPAAAKEDVRVAVLELRGPLPGEQLGLLSDEVRAGALDVARPRGYIVMSRENIAILLKDMGKDCAQAEGECEVETGRNLQAAYVLSGQVVQMGSSFICTLKVFDTESGALLASDRVRGATPDGLLDGLRPLSKRLMAQGLEAPGSLAAASAPIAVGTVTETGEAVVEVGQDADFAALAARAAAAKAKREQREAELAAEQARIEAERRAEAARLEAKRKEEAETLARERARLAEEERKAQAALLAAQRARIATARDELIAKARADLAAIAPLLKMDVTEETRPVLQAYLKKYEGAKIRVDDLVEEVTLSGVSAVRRALSVRADHKPDSEPLAKRESGLLSWRDSPDKQASHPVSRRTSVTEDAVHGTVVPLLRGIVIQGVLARYHIDPVIKRHKYQYLYCYRRQLRANPALRGTITVSFAIGADGSVRSVSTQHSTMNNPAVELCVRRMFGRFKFPKFSRGTVNVTYPLVFTPE